MKLSILKSFLLLVLVAFACEYGYAQPGAIYGRSKGKDFGSITLGDTLSFEGEIKKPRSWPAEVSIKRPGKQEFEIFRAGEATALVINNDRHYRALPEELENADSRYVFVEILSRGKVNFYELPRGKNRFMIYDGEFTPLTRSNYREIIEEIAEPCQASWCSWQRTVYNRRSLRFFFDRHNRGNLNTRFPMMNVGFSLQYNFMKMRVPGNNSLPIVFEKFDAAANYFSPALFVHIPSFKAPRVGLDIHFARHSSIASGTFDERFSQGYIKDYLLDLTYLQGGAALRYTFLWNRLEPYISGGLDYMMPAGFAGKTSYFRISQNVYTHFYSEETYPEPGALLGLSIRNGLQYSFLPRSFVAAEWGYSRYFTITDTGYHFNNLFFSLSLNVLPW
jgi:hypothetical protein